MLTGRNHTWSDAGCTELATSAPGTTQFDPILLAPLPEILRLNGYSTAQFGKCHEVRCGRRVRLDLSIVGRQVRGLNTSMALSAGETNQWYPAIHEGTKIVDPPKTPGEATISWGHD